MKNLVILLGLTLVLFRANAQSEANYKIQLDWSKQGSLTDNVVQQCDDTNIPAVEIVVPGNAKKDFVIEMGVDISDGEVFPGCSVKVKTGSSSTTYTLDAVGGGCTIRVFQLHTAPREKPKTAVYEISDAC